MRTRAPARSGQQSSVSFRLSFCLAAAGVLWGCGGATPPPASPSPPPPDAHVAPPTAPASAPMPPADPFLIRGELRAEPTSLMTTAAPELTLVTLPASSAAVAKPPKECAAFVSRKAMKSPACADATSSLAALDAAMASSDAADRDARLLGLESCAGLPVGLMRALRADLAPPACGDSLSAPLVAKPPKTMTGAVYATLLGQALAGRLARLGGGAPSMTKGPYDKDHLKEFLKTTLAPWLLGQASAIEELSRAGSKLTSYGRAIAAIEAGMADLRLVDSARSVPLPDEFAKDPELKEIYYASLEQALEPRKTRGRDAALVALGDFAAVGALHDDRVDRARQLLSKLYGGRRIDSLDALLAPELGAAKTTTPQQRLAAKLPTFYSAALLDAASADPDLVRALLDRGLPASFRAKLGSEPPADVKSLLARARLDLGRLYWRSFDFDQVVALTREAPRAPATSDTLMLATALALRGGPGNAAEMMVRAPVTALGVDDVAALQAVGAGDGPLSGQGLFDAALLVEISAASSADAAFWTSVAARYRDAAKKLTDGAARSRAEERAKNADSIAATLSAKPLERRFSAEHAVVP